MAADNIDELIRGLFAKLEARKKTIGEMREQVAKSWKTNCTFRQIGATSTVNVQTAPLEVIEECAVHLCMFTNATVAAGAALDRKVSARYGGFSADDWMSDFKKRIATISIREEERQLEAIEARLNQVLSPDERRRIEVELLARELGT